MHGVCFVDHLDAPASLGGFYHVLPKTCFLGIAYDCKPWNTTWINQTGARNGRNKGCHLIERMRLQRPIYIYTQTVWGACSIRKTLMMPHLEWLMIINYISFGG